MTERTYPGIGLLIMLTTAAVFWGGVYGSTRYAITHHREAVAIRDVCERLFDDGMTMTVNDCVRDLRP